MSFRNRGALLALLLLATGMVASSFSLIGYRRGPVPLPANYVPSIAFDSEKNLWIGTGGGGLITLSPKDEWKPIGAAEGFLGNDVSSIAFAGEEVFVGTEKGLFSRRDGVWSLTTQAAGGKFDDKSVIAVVGKDAWIGVLGSAGGLYHRKADRTWERVKGPGEKAMNDVVALLAVGETLWVGTMNNGLFRYEKGAWKQYDQEQGLPHFYVADLSWDGKGLWIALLQGGVAYLRDDKFTPYTDKDGLPSMTCRRILWDADRDELWIGTVRDGVVRYTGSKWILYGEEDGLPSRNTYALLKGEKGIWIGTDAGLAYLVP
jgi:ligand-binding sensor domain-containing protein